MCCGETEHLKVESQPSRDKKVPARLLNGMTDFSFTTPVAVHTHLNLALSHLRPSSLISSDPPTCRLFHTPENLHWPIYQVGSPISPPSLQCTPTEISALQDLPQLDFLRILVDLSFTYVVFPRSQPIEVSSPPLPAQTMRKEEGSIARAPRKHPYHFLKKPSSHVFLLALHYH